MSQPEFFDFDERLANLSKAGDPLDGLAQTVDFEIFRRPLDKALNYSDRKKGGSPALLSYSDVQDLDPAGPV